jgi:hypothetical protein
MQEYIAGVYRTEDLPSQGDFWRLHRNYCGCGFSDSQLNEELLGEYFDVFIKSDRILTLDDLQKEFPSISIVGLKQEDLN